MGLPSPAVARQALHRRSIDIEAFERADGLFDLEARLVDVKTHAIDLLSGRRDAGQPVHDMRLRITVDAGYTIVDVQAAADAVPLPGTCERIGPAYGALIGLNLLRSFRSEVRARLGRTAGCTHLSDLAALLPTAALQSVPPRRAGAGEASSASEAGDGGRPPFFVGQCHAYARDGDVVRRHYPQWFESSQSRPTP